MDRFWRTSITMSVLHVTPHFYRRCRIGKAAADVHIPRAFPLTLPAAPERQRRLTPCGCSNRRPPTTSGDRSPVLPGFLSGAQHAVSAASPPNGVLTVRWRFRCIAIHPRKSYQRRFGRFWRGKPGISPSSGQSGAEWG